MSMETIKIKYDADLYSEIIKSGRLISLDVNNLHRIASYTEKEDIRLKLSKIIKPIFEFTVGLKSTTKDLEKILRIYTPLDANAYYTEVKLDENHKPKLILEFYKF